MRIVMTVPSLAPSFGGPTAAAVGLSRQLRAGGIDVTLVGCSTAPGDGGLPVAFVFHGTPVPRSLAGVWEAIGTADVVHAIGYRDPIGTFVAAAAARRGIPLVLEPVGTLRRRLRSIVLKASFDRTLGGRVLQTATLIIATSSRELGELAVDGAPLEKLRLRPNGVDAEWLWPPPPRGRFRSRMHITDDSRVILALGRIARVKGLESLVHAVAVTNRTSLVIAGPDDRDGTLRRLRDEISKVQIGDRSLVLSRGVWGEEKRELLSDADVVCLPSVAESFGSAAAEGAAIGLPVVLTEGCGVAEFLDAETTWVVAQGNVDSLSTGLDHALESSSRAAAVAASSSVRERLSWASVAQLQLRIYEEAMTIGRRHGRRFGRSVTQ